MKQVKMVNGKVEEISKSAVITIKNNNRKKNIKLKLHFISNLSYDVVLGNEFLKNTK